MLALWHNRAPVADCISVCNGSDCVQGPLLHAVVIATVVRKLPRATTRQYLQALLDLVLRPAILLPCLAQVISCSGLLFRSAQLHNQQPHKLKKSAHNTKALSISQTRQSLASRRSHERWGATALTESRSMTTSRHGCALLCNRRSAHPSMKNQGQVCH